MDDTPSVHNPGGWTENQSVGLAIDLLTLAIDELDAMSVLSGRNQPLREIRVNLGLALTHLQRGSDVAQT